MTFATPLRLGTAALVAGAVLLAGAPAYAQADPAPPAKLTDLKARADEAVKDRLAQIDKLTDRLKAMGADCGQNADVAGQLANDRAGLQQLDATIQAETDGRKAVG